MNSSTGLSFGTLISILAVIAALGAAYVYASITAGLPSIERLPALLEPPNGLLSHPTRIYDRTGEHLLAELAPLNAERRYLQLENISPSLIEAVLAVYEPNFWSSPGYSINGETIAQRLVSVLLMEEEESGLRRDIRVRLLAGQITNRFGREQILEWYLNSAAFGPRVYGVETAAHAYFGKSASDLTLAEATALAAASQIASISPSDARQNITNRQQVMMGTMLAQGWITPEDVLEASGESVTFEILQDPPSANSAGYLELVTARLYELYGRERVERGGLIVTTTLDYDLQQQAACTAAEQLRRLNGNLPPTLETEQDCQASQLLPSFSVGQATAAIDYHTNLIVLNPSTGEVLALAADRPEIPGLSGSSLRPTGTLITPLVYLASFTRGIGPASLVWDVPPELLSGEDGISSETAALYHGPVRLRIAFANDYTSPALQVLAQIGPETVARTASQLGLNDFTANRLAASVDGEEIFPGQASLVDLAQAYGAIAAGGYLSGEAGSSLQPVSPIEPVVILRIEDTQGERLLDCAKGLSCQLESRSVLSTELAYLVHNILSDNFSRWPSLGHPNLLETGQTAGAKIGRVDDISGWAAGYIQDRVVVTWVGSGPETPPESSALDPVYGSTGVRASAALWRAMIQYAARTSTTGQPAAWTQPSGIREVMVCDPSGLLPTEICPTTVTELFLAGNEPQQLDTLFRSYPINRETGRLATIFTPAGLIEEQVYMAVPSFAREWADAVGIQSAPTGYDVITSLPDPNPEAVITSPVLFAYSGGRIKIEGTAAGDDFVYYRLQAGAGLNPTEWLQIGTDMRTPVIDGLLAEWDTGELRGLYALQLLVVREDQSVDSSIIQITIDNETPAVLIVSPQDGEPFNQNSNPVIVLHAIAGDETALERVEFYIDNQLLASLLDEPFTLAWQAQKGTHTFRVVVYDTAGNRTEEEINFTVR